MNETNWMDVIHGMIGKMRLTEENWKDRENWLLNETAKMYMVAGRSENNM